MSGGPLQPWFACVDPPLPSTMGVKKPVKKQVKSTPKKVADPLFPARKKSFRIGRDIQPKVDLSRFVKWPRYIRLQRQRKILVQRLKVPPSINQFSKTLDKNQATELLKLLMKYQPEDKKAKQQRLKQIAAAKEAGKEPAPSKAPKVIKFGLKHVTTLIEEQKASLVVIAHDVNPIELVVWLPALCRKMGVPYCIMKGKARLGTLVHQKNAAVICLTSVNKEDESKLNTLKSNFTAQFNEGFQRKWGGGIMGLKTQRKLEKRQKAIEAELAKKAQY